MPAPSPFLQERHARVRATLQELALDALVVTHAPNVLYLTNHAASAGLLVLTPDAVHVVSDFRYAEAVARLQASSHACPGLMFHQVPASYDEALVALLAEFGLKHVGFEAVHLSVARFEWLRRTIQARKLSIVLSPTERVLESERLIKDAWELDAMRESASRLHAVADAAFRAVSVGVSERRVAAAIEQALREAGYDRVAFDTIVASGSHAALPHHRASDRSLESGDIVVLDFGGVLDGYCCDLTRTVSVGPVGPDFAHMYEAVRDAQAAAIEAVRPGIPASDVDGAARGVLESRGLGHAFGHGTGHGLGLEVHEDPRVTRPQPEQPSAVLQPGVVVTKDGCEVLTSVTRDLLIR